jgi:hypothetical protein
MKFFVGNGNMQHVTMLFMTNSEQQQMNDCCVRNAPLLMDLKKNKKFWEELIAYFP